MIENSSIKIVKRPNALVCYICGKQYGSHSLKIHLKTCEKKWEIEQSKKPEHLRRPVPQAPSLVNDMINGDMPINLNNASQV